MRKTPKRIVFGIPEADHAIIKKKAFDCGVTMQRYILQAIQRRMNEESKIVVDGSQTPKRCRC